MSFTHETMWLKDYYMSRINLEVRAMVEQEGVVRIRVGDQNSSHLYVASENDDSGLTPRRFHADIDDMHELRNPK
jgi:hypothetical protein